MKPTTKILVDEHENILKLADALEKKARDLELGKEIDKVFFERAIDFIRNYADRFHHAKEEDILFKEMCKGSGQENLHCNPVEQMLYEHDLGRNFVKGMEESVNKKDAKKVAENARGYVSLIREHIFKENNILYPMADGVLNEKVEESMLKKFKDADKKRAKDKERCLDFLKTLKQ